MNFRKLLTYLTVGTAAVIPFAGAQNPTILQGSYISNVFGNSNFVKNPNAQTNVANVTNATRSITTPLVATSEFNLNLTSGTFATWTLRVFDAGMKGQNCEARFSYRGFATATTTAEIVQNSLVVAQLVLTPSTDPRIASINFPCGDLVNATTFRIAQTTANMTIVTPNEIGGIYVGLATNMANVAQAEIVARIYLDGCGTEPSATSTSFADLSGGATCSTTTINGDNVSFNTATGQLTVTNAKPGRYVLDGLSFYGVGTITNSDLQGRWLESTSNIASGLHYIQTLNVTGTPLYASRMPQGSWEFTNTATRIFKPQIRLGNSTNVTVGRLQYTGGQSAGSLVLTRFPSSSELVVTPERQNTWAGVVYTAESQILFTTSAEPTAYSSYNNATWNQPTKLKGKAAVTTTNSGNDLGFSVANLPIGNYKLTISGVINAVNSLDAVTRCNYKIVETTTSTDIAKQVHQDMSFAAGIVDETRDYTNSFFGVFNNTSVATRNFRLEAQKFEDTTTGNVGYCQAFSGSTSNTYNSNIAFLLEPLDQPSNSALYVQGPVLGAQTGAAIPSGYQMEGISSVSSSLTSQSNGAYKTGTGITLNSGVYFVTGYVETTGVAPTATICGLTKTANSAPIDDDTSMTTRQEISDSSNTLRGFRCKVTGYFRVTSATTFYTTNYVNAPTSSGYTFNYLINAIRLN